MKLYDITRELFSSTVYPGDEKPSYVRSLKIKNGAPCNLTNITMCAHNGTHIDAPYHFYDNGKTIEQIDLHKCIGPCTVVYFPEQPNLEDMIKILEKSEKKILLKGNIIVSLELAKLFNEYHIELVGVEGQSVGPVDAPREVHLELLKQEVVLLEGIQLDNVQEGNYLLSSAPIKMGGSDGAPCRAILIDME